MNARRLIGILAFPALVLNLHEARGIIRRHDRSDAKYLELGEKYPCVTPLGGGTATLIASQWLLTAGHVAHGLSPFDRSVSFNGKIHRIEGVAIHPKWKARSRFDSLDIALVKLAVPVKNITPAGVYKETDEDGRQVVFVGIGRFGDGKRGPQGDDGRRRGATNTVVGTKENWIVFKFDAPPEGTELEGISGPGDSGGPALIDVDGKLFVIGVSSANDDEGASGPCRYHSTEYYARVSTAGKWIADTMREGLGSRESTDPIVDLATGGLPDSRSGQIAKAFFKAYATNDDEKMKEFEETYRADRALRQRPVNERIRAWGEYHKAWGPLKPTKYVETAEGQLVVLVYAEGQKVWKSLAFEIESTGARKLIGIDVTSPISPAE